MIVIRGAIALIVLVTAFGLSMRYATGELYPNCTEFGMQISTNCCCSANCCAEANEGEFRNIRDDIYQSTVTGQTLPRTGWSVDGRTIKCACDSIDGKWTKHPRAFIRCLYLPMPSS
jgi:hypothetical protein